MCFILKTPPWTIIMLKPMYIKTYFSELGTGYIIYQPSNDIKSLSTMKWEDLSKNCEFDFSGQSKTASMLFWLKS